MFNPEIQGMGLTSDKSGDFTVECAPIGGSGGCVCVSTCNWSCVLSCFSLF